MNLSSVRFCVSITLTPLCASSLALLPTHNRRWSGCKATRTGCWPAGRSSTRWKVVVSISATLPAAGIDTYTCLSSLLAAQSIGTSLRPIRARVLVTPPTDTDGSITVRLASLFSTSRK